MRNLKDEMLFRRIKEFFLEYLPTIRQCGRNTIRAYKTALNQFLDFVAKSCKNGLSGICVSDFSPKNVSDFMDHLSTHRNCSISTCNHRLDSIRSFISYAAQIDPALLSIKSALGKVAYKKDVRPHMVKHMSEAAIKALLTAPGCATRKGLRDTALLVFMYDTACRVQEISDACVGDVCLGGNPSAVLHGKGGKIRMVPLMPRTVRILKAYIAESHGNVEINPKEPLFCTKHFKLLKKMSVDNIRVLVREYAKKARLTCSEVPDSVHPHMLRHSRAMHLYMNNMPLELVSQWLGHSQLETTLVYAKADTEMKRKAIESATPEDNPLRKYIKPRRMTVESDDIIKHLYALS